MHVAAPHRPLPLRRSAARPAALAVLAALALSACASTAPVRPAVKGPPVPQALGAGLERVMGKDARALQELLGAPDQDVREQRARRLQFSSALCVLDAYLYPPASGREPVVTWIDTRLSNGNDIDRASCIAALSRRREAR
ncbi:MAG: hypothetical protein JWN59_901 [Sphingomonas bacterium]|jgi:hypothetical protein|nr:hypothetical protein [Sphingomonas bacterium]